MTNGYKAAKAVWASAERNANLSAVGIILFFGALVAILHYAQHRHAPLETQRFVNDSTVAMLAFLVAFSLYLLGRWQMRLTFLQIEQAEELANRKDERLITAIESLTEELKRRPTPIETVNFSLFGGKK